MKIRNRIRELRTVKAAELTPNPKNWRMHPKAQQDALRGILAEVGYADALLARELPDGSLVLVDGHLRAETTPDEKVPVLILDINEAEADKLLLSLDPLAALAETNAAALDSLLREIDTGSEGLQQMYADMAEAADLYQDEPAEVVEDEVPEPPVDPITKPGDLWLLGEHRLLCGDSTKAEDVERLMAGAKAVASWADPPYTKDYESRGDKGSCVRSDIWRAILEAAKANRGAAWFVKVPWTDMPTAINELLPDHCIVWAKRGFGLGGKDFRPQHEMILYGRSGGQCHAGDDVGDVWEFPVPFRGRMLHVAETPVALIAKAIGYVTNNSDLVFDPFLGSGTTLIAAEQLGRKCYGMEISPQYCDVIVKRWETLTGKKAELEGKKRGKTRTKA